MKKKITPLSEVLRDLIEGGALAPDPAVPQILEIWPRMVPESLRPFVCLEGLREGVLVVAVSHPVAGQQLQFLRENFRNRINQELGRPVIKELRLKMGALPPDEPERKILVEDWPGTPRILTRKEKGAIKRLTGEIKNSELRERLQILMEKSLGFSVPESAEPRENKRRAPRKPSKGGGSSVPPPRT
ncbi:MAG: DUF721 domain-containing protein [Deltaproteobacteria bacterium]|nr:DUF721 domain-containing protein [Deltaproteobacteria bacterium]